MNIYAILFLTTLLPIGVALGFYFLQEKTKFKNLSYWTQQIIIGVAFGLVAVFATEFGATLPGATANIRDSGPLLAGFLFGGPAGIIAGLIGGVERFLCVYWGGGTFTRWACSVSTVLAGVYAWAVRKYMFDNKRPSWGFAIAVSVVMEVIHLTLVFLFRINDPTTAMNIIKQLALPMILANAFSVFVPTFVIQMLNRDKEEKYKYKKIATQVQWWLLGSIVACYLISTSIVYMVQTNTAYQDADKTFNISIEDVVLDVNESSNTYMTTVLTDIKEKYELHPYNPSDRKTSEEYFRSLMTTKTYQVASIDLINNDGTFACSSDSTFDYVFKMTDAEQSNDIHQHMIAKDAKPYVQAFQQQGDKKVSEYKKYAACRVNDTYYLVISLNNSQFHELVDAEIYNITSNRHVRNTGYVLIFDHMGVIKSDEADRKGKQVGLQVKDLNDKSTEFTRRRGTVYETDSFFMNASAETYYIVIVLPYEEVLGARDSSFILNSFMEIIVFAILYAMIYFLLKAHVVKKIEKINASLNNIIDGDLSVKVDVTSSYEFASLSDDINFTVDTLERYITEANKRIDDELAFAKTIQLSSLPVSEPSYPDHPQFGICATMNTAKEVGGDFYDYFLIGEDTVAFLIADVSGKGIPAAMFMMESKAMIKNLAKTHITPAEVLSRANESIAQDNKANMFITCWFGMLNYKTGHVTFANAGHNNPLIYRKDGSWEYVKQKKNIVLAIMEDTVYDLQEFDIKPGDRMYLYTDGVTEATRHDGTLYGEDRLETYLNEHKSDTLREITDGIQKDIDLFVNGADQFDDITMLTIEYRGNIKK